MKPESEPDESDGSGAGGQPELCVVLGAPRSGTTWLQRLLGCSKQISTPQETTIFHRFLLPQWEHWDRQDARLQRYLRGLGAETDVEGRVVGLSTILDEDDVLESQRLLLERVLQRCVEAKPSASMIAEKTPSNSLCVDVIDRVCPTARFVHIVRDPRDVMASLRDARASSWGARWAPDNALSAAHVWLDHYLGAREAARLGPARYLEIRYEGLRADPTTAVSEVVEFLGLPDAPADLVAAESSAQDESFTEVFAFHPRLAAELEKLPNKEPSGFRSRGRRPLGPTAMQAAESVLGPVAREAGYRDGWPQRTVAGRYVLAAGARSEAGVAMARRAIRHLRPE